MEEITEGKGVTTGDRGVQYVQSARNERDETNTEKMQENL